MDSSTSHAVVYEWRVRDKLVNNIFYQHKKGGFHISMLDEVCLIVRLMEDNENEEEGRKQKKRQASSSCRRELVVIIISIRPLV